MEAGGKVVQGLGEGRKYVKLYSDKFLRVLGIRPFEGTLNISVRKGIVEKLRKLEAPLSIEGFEKGGKRFGWVKIFLATLKAKEEIDCWLVVPEFSKHEDQLELISELNLRSTLGLKDGDEVRVRIAT